MQVYIIKIGKNRIEVIRYIYTILCAIKNK